MEQENLDAKMRRIEKLMSASIELMPSLGRRTKKPLPPSVLQAFEESHGIELPGDFKAYLLRFGDEAILPRVFQKKMLPMAEWTENGIYKCFRGELKKPFAYTGKKPLALEWDEEKDDYVHLTPLEGTLCLGSGGCDILWILVVQGPEKGKVWCFVPGAEKALMPTGLGFLEWCEEELKKENEETIRLRKLAET